jgi:hypothetical protein
MQKMTKIMVYTIMGKLSLLLVEVSFPFKRTLEVLFPSRTRHKNLDYAPPSAMELLHGPMKPTLDRMCVSIEMYIVPGTTYWMAAMNANEAQGRFINFVSPTTTRQKALLFVVVEHP